MVEREREEEGGKEHRFCGISHSDSHSIHYRALCPRFARFVRCPPGWKRASSFEREIDFKGGGLDDGEGKLGKKTSKIWEKKKKQEKEKGGRRLRIYLL